MAFVLEVDDLRTRFTTETGQVTAVDGVSFKVRPGEIVGLVGESGCGKSVTAESLMRLQDPDTTEYSGSVTFKGQNLLEVSEAQMRDYRGGRISMVFQDPMSSLNPVFTIGNQLAETILAHEDVTKKQAMDRALELLERTGIPEPAERLRQYPHQLSGGQRQRVVIAMALACNPELLIADEPTTALDVTTQEQILQLILNLREEYAAGTVFITHDLGVVAEVCDRVIVMYLGQVIEDTDVMTLFDKPAHPYTQGLMRSTPALDTDPEVDLPVIPGTVPTLNNVPAGCRFAARCPFATEACRAAVPELRQISPDHRVRCIRAEEIAAMDEQAAGKETAR